MDSQPFGLKAGTQRVRRDWSGGGTGHLLSVLVSVACSPSVGSGGVYGTRHIRMRSPGSVGLSAFAGGGLTPGATDPYTAAAPSPSANSSGTIPFSRTSWMNPYR